MKEKCKKALIPCLVAIAVCCFCIAKGQYEKSTPVASEKEEMIVYLLYDKMLVEVPSMTSLTKTEDKIMEMVHYMGEEVAPFEKLLNEGTQLDKVEIKEGVASLYFTSLEYEKEKELQVLESLIYNCTQFADVDAITLLIEEKPLSAMPMNHTPLRTQNRRFGINHFDSNQLYLHEGSFTTLYFETQIQKKTYVVPRSVKVKRDDYEALLDAMLKSPNAASSLVSPLSEANIKKAKAPQLEKGVLHLYLSKEALNKDQNVKKKVLRTLKKNWKDCEGVKYISIHVNDKVIAVNGKNKVKL